MRKVIASINVTLDGYMSGPDCELDWHFERWTLRMSNRITEELSKAGIVLLGRVTYEAMAAYFPARHNNEFTDLLNEQQKVVFSSTLKKTNWNNSSILNGDLEKEIIRLKESAGRNILIFGSGKLVNALAELKLVDEYHLWLHPVFLGEGKPLFKHLHQMQHLQLFHLETFSSGVVVLYYRSQGF